MNNILKILISILVCGLVLCGCSNFSDGENSSQASDVTSVMTESEIIEYSQKTKLITDKNEYSRDETVTFQIIPPKETDYVAYGRDCKVQYWDESSSSWKYSDKQYEYFEDMFQSKGDSWFDFVFSERCDETAPKYRIALNVILNRPIGISVEIYSNEFTIAQ